ncbi:hypothetical protein LTR85_008730 [Meristemomyces frigidus]|nr:hypothetical protein LTR85_008730 [Meristemomyces frigidus]
MPSLAKDETIVGLALTVAAYYARDKDEDEKSSKHPSSKTSKKDRPRSPTPEPGEEGDDDYYESEEAVRGTNTESSRRSERERAESDRYAAEAYDGEFVPPLRVPAAPESTFTDALPASSESGSGGSKPKYEQREHYRGADESFMGEADYAQDRHRDR